MANALVLKTSGRKPLQVRVLHPPFCNGVEKNQRAQALRGSRPAKLGGARPSFWAASPLPSGTHSYCSLENPYGMPEPIDLRIIKLGREASGITPENKLPAPEDPEDNTLPGAEHPTYPVFLSWKAPEFTYDPATLRIRTAIGALLVAGGVVAAFFKNFLFAILLAVAGGLILAYAAKPPRTLSCAVTARGIAVGSRLYEFEELTSFWIFYDPPLFKELALQSKKTFMPMVRIPLGDLDPLRLREVLLPFVKEQRQEASAIDIIAKRLGF